MNWDWLKFVKEHLGYIIGFPAIGITLLLLVLNVANKWVSELGVVITLILGVHAIFSNHTSKKQLKQLNSASSAYEEQLKQLDKVSRASKKQLDQLGRTNLDSKEQLDKIKEIADEIADCTRKPLSDIGDVLDQIYHMFCGYQNAVLGGGPKFDIWFLGFTLGLGYAHRVDPVTTQWKKKNKHTKDFTTFTDELHTVLDSCINHAKENVHCYCLDHNNQLNRDINTVFILPLYARYGNIPHNVQDENTKLLKEYHSNLEKIIQRYEKDGATIKATEDVPLQVIVTTIKKSNGEIGRAVIVFNVGALNVGTVGTDEVAGFYSESEYLCEMFKNYIESLGKSFKMILPNIPFDNSENRNQQPSTTPSPTNAYDDLVGIERRFDDPEEKNSSHELKDTTSQQDDGNSAQVSQYI